MTAAGEVVDETTATAGPAIATSFWPADHPVLIDCQLPDLWTAQGRNLVGAIGDKPVEAGELSCCGVQAGAQSLNLSGLDVNRSPS